MVGLNLFRYKIIIIIYREEEREMFQLLEEEKMVMTPYSPLAAGRVCRMWQDDIPKDIKLISEIRKNMTHLKKEICLLLKELKKSLIN